MKEENREMSQDFDKAMEKLQTSIIEDARKVYSEEVIQRWLRPRYMGEMESCQMPYSHEGSKARQP